MENKNINIPKPSNNIIRDICEWLKIGDVIILHDTKKKFVYHIPNFLPNRKIYINVSTDPSLMNDGEWPAYIKTTNAEQLIDDDIQCPNGTFKFVVPSLWN